MFDPALLPQITGVDHRERVTKKMYLSVLDTPSFDADGASRAQQVARLISNADNSDLQQLSIMK